LGGLKEQQWLEELRLELVQWLRELEQQLQASWISSKAFLKETLRSW